MTTEDIMRIAFHEAGHAVVAFHEHHRQNRNGLPIEYVSIRDYRDNVSCVMPTDWGAVLPLAPNTIHLEENRDDVKSLLRFHLGGIPAEARHTGIDILQIFALHDGVGGDVPRCRRLLLFPPLEVEERLLRLLAEVDVIIRDQWSYVGRIAHKLVRHGHLDADTVAALLQPPAS